MSWHVVSPTTVESSKAVIIEVDIPLFTDDIEYEQILGRAFSSPADRDRLASGLVIVLATKEGSAVLRAIHDLPLDIPVHETLIRMAFSRNIVALRWTEAA